MGMTNTHDKSLSDESFRSLEKVWTPFVSNEMDVWLKFHKYWFQQAQQGVPVEIIRYEDILCSREKATNSMTDFFRTSEPSVLNDLLLRRRHNNDMSRQELLEESFRTSRGPG